MKKTKLIDTYSERIACLISKDQMKWIDKQGKRSDVIRKLIDKEMELTK